MPWARQISNELLRVNSKAIRLYYGERDVDIMLKELIVRTETLQRNFTKRQQKIILFITILSYPFNKTSALVPNVQDFCLCGIGASKIRGEIDKLVDLNVIEHDEEKRLYTIKDPKYWEVPRHSLYVGSRAEELVELNMRDAGFETSKD
ncbi:replication protein [Priestia megaterium]|uniref:replication protein n=1 Tax=Priestia megaterium TaxID=1404 RepID=UPI000BFE9ACF|nr:replication protein [Priestia megaterium]PGO60625.1 hypothetical protein CN981_08735 [Priestia megaterium]